MTRKRRMRKNRAPSSPWMGPTFSRTFSFDVNSGRSDLRSRERRGDGAASSPPAVGGVTRGPPGQSGPPGATNLKRDVDPKAEKTYHAVCGDFEAHGAVLPRTGASFAAIDASLHAPQRHEAHKARGRRPNGHCRVWDKPCRGVELFGGGDRTERTAQGGHCVGCQPASRAAR